MSGAKPFRRLVDGSRMSREAHVRFWEGAGVQLPRATRLLVLSERHLRRILAQYFSYYHRARTHLALAKDAPAGRPVEPPEVGTLVQISEVGGLHHRYVRRAA
jgi:transposase InsO family protein